MISVTASTARMRVPRRRVTFALLGTASFALVVAGASIVRAQSTGGGGGTAVYWMTADTASGMGAMTGGGRPGGMNLGAMMRGMGGGAPSYSHNLQLQLGTGRKAPGEPNAEHLPPPGLQAGQSLPLLTPHGTPSEPTPWKMEKPKGRLLIYWGCGDRARAGQPVVLDYAAMAAGKMPPAFASVKTMSGPGPGRNATYGEWPNSRSDTRVPAGGSLVGAHVVRGNYTPEIKFTLAPGQDFLAPVSVTGNEAGPSGSVPLAWQPVSGARAWFVSTMGAGRNGDMILWSSSESQAMPMMMSNVSPDEIGRLVQSKVLLPATATRCTVPAEVVAATGEGAVLITTAFGPEANFSYPARPAKAPASWRPDWTVKLLTKSTYTGMLGMDMSAMMGGYQGSGGEEQEAPQPQKRRKNPFGGLGGLLGN